MSDNRPIRLRVAGIYYEESFTLDELTAVRGEYVIPGRVATPPDKYSIFELLEAAVKRPGADKKNFRYVFERRVTEKHGVALSLTSVGVFHEADISNTLGGNQRLRGDYQLTEIAIPNGVVAWQSYVYRDGISITQLKPGTGSGYSPVVDPDKRGFTPFDKTYLHPGDEVIWRQVAILRGPRP